MTKTATKTYLVGVIERAISYFKVEAQDARTAAENWQEGEFRDRDDEALEAEGPCNVREQQPDGTFLMLPSSAVGSLPNRRRRLRQETLLRPAALSRLRQRQWHGDVLRLRRSHGPD